MPGRSVPFDRAVDYYDTTRGFPPGIEVQAGETLAAAAGLNGTQDVLEIGVGTGRIASPLRPHVHTYTGIDLSRGMMSRIPAKPGGHTVNRVQGSITDLPFPSSHFDAVVAVHIFHLVEGWRQALDEVARVLKPGGVLVQAYNHRPKQANNLWDILRRAIGEGVPPVGVSFRSYATFLPESGWTRASEPLTLEFTYRQAPAEIIEWAENRYFSMTWHMTDEQHQRALNAMKAYSAEHYHDPTQPVEMIGELIAEVYHPPAL